MSSSHLLPLIRSSYNACMDRCALLIEAMFIVKHRMTAADLARTVHVYPTVAESILRAESDARAA